MGKIIRTPFHNIYVIKWTAVKVLELDNALKKINLKIYHFQKPYLYRFNDLQMD